jgi:hypothetical protein
MASIARTVIWAQGPFQPTSNDGPRYPKAHFVIVTNEILVINGVIKRMSDTAYWLKVREGFFVHNEDWSKVVDRLPDFISSNKMAIDLQSLDQIINSGMKGKGSVGSNTIEVNPMFLELVETGNLQEGKYTVEYLLLEWMYQLYLVEAICAHYHNTPLPQWPSYFASYLEVRLHAMTYLSAMILLHEENRISSAFSSQTLSESEPLVKERVKELTSTLYAKASEYGESFRRNGIQGCLPRIWDKIARYVHLSALGCTAKYEPKIDSSRDLLGYCMIAWSLVHELD